MWFRLRRRWRLLFGIQRDKWCVPLPPPPPEEKMRHEMGSNSGVSARTSDLTNDPQFVRQESSDSRLKRLPSLFLTNHKSGCQQPNLEGHPPSLTCIQSDCRGQRLPSVGVKEGLGWVFSRGTMARKIMQLSPSLTPTLGSGFFLQKLFFSALCGPN